MKINLLPLIVVASTAVSLLVTPATPAQASVLISPSTPVAGVSQQVLAGQYSDWLVDIIGPTTDERPLLNTSNASPVLFVPVTYFPTATFNLTVTAGVPLFFPVLVWQGFWDADQSTDDPPCNTAADRWACNQLMLATYADNPTSLTLRVDGVNIPVTDEHRLNSGGVPYHKAVGPNNSGVDPGDYDWLFDGWWTALSPLALGQHVVEYGFDYSGTGVMTTTHLSVVPVSATPGLVTLGLLALLVQRRQRRQPLH